MAGSVLSANRMCWVQIEVWPLRLVADQMRSMPARPVQFVGVATSVKLIVALPPPQLPLAVAMPVLFVLVGSPHCNCRSGGQLSRGAPASMTVTVNWQALLLHWLESVTVKLSVNEPAVVACTATLCVLVAPLMAPFPVMDQP